MTTINKLNIIKYDIRHRHISINIDAYLNKLSCAINCYIHQSIIFPHPLPIPFPFPTPSYSFVEYPCCTWTLHTAFVWCYDVPIQVKVRNSVRGVEPGSPSPRNPPTCVCTVWPDQINIPLTMASPTGPVHWQSYNTAHLIFFREALSTGLTYHLDTYEWDDANTSK